MLQRPVTAAINHPVGLVAEALLSLWFRSEPDDGDHLPTEIQALFTKICDTQKERLRHGRVLLASRLIPLYRVDPSWTKEHLLPLFSWAENSMEARLAWEGFLWSPRLYWPLLHAFRTQFLETASHYHSLGEHGEQYVALLTYAALEPMDEDEPFDFRSAFQALPHEGLQEAARTLFQALESSGAQSGNYWINRIVPFWHDVWPKSVECISGDIAESLALTSIAAGDQFMEAVELFRAWFQPVEHPSYIVHRLQKTDLCSRFPTPALGLLDAVIKDPRWPIPGLDQCLKDVSQADPNLETDPGYQRMLAWATEGAV